MFKDIIVEFYLTEQCNMRCRYCYLNKHNKRISWATAKQAIDFIASLRCNSVIICFFGGEPLSEWGLLKKAVSYAKIKKINRFNICTNATLIDRETLLYFKKNNIVPMFSIDGIKLAHNRERVFKNREGTHGLLDKKLNIVKKYFVDSKIQIQITVTKDTVSSLKESVQYFLSKDLNLDINIVPVISLKRRYKWDKKSLMVFRKNIFSIAGLLLENYKKGRKINITNMCCAPMRDLLNLAKEDNINRYCGLAETHLSISIDGRLYPCFYFAGIKNNRAFVLGDIWNGIKMPNQLLKKIQYLKNRCRGAFSCPVNNYIINGDILKPVETYNKINKYWLNASKYVIENIK